MSLQNNNKRRGRALEKAIAKLLGGLNIGTLGGEDILHDDFSIECKSRQAFVADKWYEQCVKNNKRGKMPIVVIHIKGRAYDTSYVMLSIKDFLKLLKKGGVK